MCERERDIGGVCVREREIGRECVCCSVCVL